MLAYAVRLKPYYFEDNSGPLNLGATLPLRNKYELWLFIDQHPYKLADIDESKMSFKQAEDFAQRLNEARDRCLYSEFKMEGSSFG